MIVAFHELTKIGGFICTSDSEITCLWDMPTEWADGVWRLLSINILRFVSCEQQEYPWKARPCLEVPPAPLEACQSPASQNSAWPVPKAGNSRIWRDLAYNLWIVIYPHTISFHMSFVGFPYFCFVSSGGTYVLAIWVIQSDFSKSQTKGFQTVRPDHLHIYIYMLSVTFGFQIAKEIGLEVTPPALSSCG